MTRIRSRLPRLSPSWSRKSALLRLALLSTVQRMQHGGGSGGESPLLFAHAESMFGPAVDQPLTLTVDTAGAGVSGFAFFDTNNDGVRDSSRDWGIYGVDVHIYTCADATIGTARTNSLGRYSFGGLAAGRYYVLIPVTPQYYALVDAWNGETDKVTGELLHPGADNTVNPATGRTECFALGEGEQKSVSFGMKLDYSPQTPRPAPPAVVILITPTPISPLPSNSPVAPPPTGTPSDRPTTSGRPTPPTVITLRPTPAVVVPITSAPISVASLSPSNSPVADPPPTSEPPSESPSNIPSKLPTAVPSLSATSSPSLDPTPVPAAPPLESPTKSPAIYASKSPSKSPLQSPTAGPTSEQSSDPEKPPLESPSKSPSTSPTRPPSPSPTLQPSSDPTSDLTAPPTTLEPTPVLTFDPTSFPSGMPTVIGSHRPSTAPSFAISSTPSALPSMLPTLIPSIEPTASVASAPPSVVATERPSTNPTMKLTWTGEEQGPITMKRLHVNIRGIEQLEDVDAWQDATGEYIMTHFNATDSDLMVFDVSVSIRVTKQTSSNTELFNRRLPWLRSGRRWNNERRLQSKNVEVMYDQTTTYKAPNPAEDLKDDARYIALAPFTGRAALEQYTAALKRLSPYYASVASIGSVTVDPPPPGMPIDERIAGGARGPPPEKEGMDNMMITIIVAVCAGGILVTVLILVAPRRRREKCCREAESLPLDEWVAGGDLGDGTSSSGGGREAGPVDENELIYSSSHTRLQQKDLDVRGRTDSRFDPNALPSEEEEGRHAVTIHDIAPPGKLGVTACTPPEGGSPFVRRESRPEMLSRISDASLDAKFKKVAKRATVMTRSEIENEEIAAWVSVLDVLRIETSDDDDEDTDEESSDDTILREEYFSSEDEIIYREEK